MNEKNPVTEDNNEQTSRFKSHNAPASREARLKARPKPGDKPISREDLERALVEAKTRPLDTKSDGSKEIGGRGGLEPTRYGDWEVGGRCTDF